MMRLWALLLSVSSVAGAADPVYKWTDESGVVHFSARKPDDVKVTEVRLLPAPNEGSKPSVPIQSSSDATQPQETLLAQRNREARKALCDHANRQYARLSDAGLVFRERADGVKAPLSDEEKMAGRDAALREIAKHCDRIESDGG